LPSNVKALEDHEFVIFLDFCLAKIHTVIVIYMLNKRLIYKTMKKIHLLSVLLLFVPYVNSLFGHCQVPCGVYTDDLRFMQMLEDQSTIEKASKLILELSSKDDGLSHNQLARWVSTKDSHASKIQKIIAEYFLIQRVKSSAKNYEQLLKGAHDVMVSAMKCKQSTDSTTSENLKNSILTFQKIYASK
jgi:nickel superoxide dismutase